MKGTINAQKNCTSADAQVCIEVILAIRDTALQGCRRVTAKVGILTPLAKVQNMVVKGIDEKAVKKQTGLAQQARDRLLLLHNLDLLWLLATCIGATSFKHN